MAALMAAAPSGASRWIAAIRFCSWTGSSGPARRSIQVWSARKPLGSSSRPGSRIGMTGKSCSRAWRSRATWTSRCCQEPMRWPTNTATAPDRPSSRLEKWLPGLAGRQPGAIKEAGDAGFGQARAHRRDRLRVGAAVAKETSLAVGATIASCFVVVIRSSRRAPVNLNLPALSSIRGPACTIAASSFVHRRARRGLPEVRSMAKVSR